VKSVDGMTDYERMQYRRCYIAKVTMKRSGVQFIVPRPVCDLPPMDVRCLMTMGARIIGDPKRSVSVNA
jgi:hypothetical protein